MEKCNNDLSEKDLSEFPNIEILSSAYCAFQDLPTSGIRPFNKADIQTAIDLGQLESRSFQSKEVEDEFWRMRAELESQNIGNEELGQKLAKFARDFHIRRVAFLASHLPMDPIVLGQNGSLSDGLHRVIAAKFLGHNSIPYVT